MARILIIDDHDEFRRMLNRMLTQAGYEVVEASDGKKACKIYHEQPVDLVITDIFMPEKDGIETVEELREMSPDLKIMAVSGGGGRYNTNYLDIIRSLGVQKTFEKPFVPDEFLLAVKELLEME